MSPTRRELVRATRARIVDAAGRLTRERGPNGFSMDVLAKEAGVARATVYEHFRSKRAVLDELASSIARSVVIEESRGAASDPLIALRDMLGDVCRHWAEHEERMRGLRTLTALTGSEQAGDGVDDKQLRRLVEALASANQMRGHWSVEEAVDALGALTSYATYERLRRAPRTPEQVEAVLAKLVVSIVSPSAASNSTPQQQTPAAAGVNNG
jgi:AcrR family transcriptional regulator